MINFASLFNQFRGSSNNPVNDLLQQNDVCLPKLLDEDSFITEFKAGNTKLIQFMKYSKIKELVDYITTVGPEGDKKRSYKYPLTASEVLSSDLASVQEFFLTEGKLYEEKVTYEEQVVEEEVDMEEEQNGDEIENSKNQEQEQKQKTGKEGEIEQKTIIKDSLQTGEEQTNSKVQQSQSTSESPLQIIQPIQQKPQQPSTFPQQPQLSSAQSPSQQQSPSQPQPSQPQPQSCQQPQSPTPTHPKKKTIHRTHQVQTTTKTQVPPLIHHLYSYFDQQVNYILTGYVCKVLTSLFAKKGNQMMEFLFEGNRIERMVRHIESRSVGEFLMKVLTFESGKWAAERAGFFSRLLQMLAGNGSVHVLSNFSAFVSETIEKAAANAKSTSPVPEFTTIFFTPEVVTIVIRNVMSEHENVCVYNAPILLTYLTNVPFTLPQDENIINQFKSLLQMFIQKSLERLMVNHQNRPKLGFGRIKIIEILNYILKENLLGSRKIFAEKYKALSILFDLCKNYEMNNVLHNQVVKLITLAFSDADLSQSLVKNDVFLNFILTEAQEDQKIRKGTGSQKYRKGYIGHVVQMARLVQENASKDNKAAIQILQRDEFEKVLTTLVERQISQGNKNLGGFSFIKNLKSEVMFQKQDIISHYIDFLTHSPKPVFQAEPEPVNIEHPDFLEEMQRQIEENLCIEEQSKPTPPEGIVQKVEEASQTPPEPQIRVEIHFFKGHLDYDLDELIGDL